MHIVFPGIVKIERIPFLIENGIKLFPEISRRGAAAVAGAKPPRTSGKISTKLKL
jgi:hypothetical protein